MLSDDKDPIKTVIESAIDVMDRYVFRKPESVIGIEMSDSGWTVTVEAIERKSVPDTQDLLGKYEIKFSTKGKVLGWKRTMVRRRTEWHFHEKEV